MKAEEMLQGQEGTFTCSALQPFTVYSVTITLPPSTILYTRLLRTKETGTHTKCKGALCPAAQPECPLPAVMVLGLGLVGACGALGKGLCRALQHNMSPPHSPLPHRTVAAAAEGADFVGDKCSQPSCVTLSSCASSARQT